MAMVPDISLEMEVVAMIDFSIIDWKLVYDVFVVILLAWNGIDIYRIRKELKKNKGDKDDEQSY